jgi:hypothetical protein
MCVDDTEDGIRAIGTREAAVDVYDETVAQDTSDYEDSEESLNREILALEMLDFDDEEGIDSDLEEDN